MEGLLQDLRYAARQLARSPGFSAVVVLTLALGIGANSTIFTWVDATLLQPLPGVAAQSGLLALVGESPRQGVLSLSYPDYLGYRASGAFSGLLAQDEVVGLGGRLCLVGLALGFLASLGATRFLSALLLGVGPLDPVTLTTVPLLLGGVAFLACAAPAWRAARLDPLEALRHE